MSHSELQVLCVSVEAPAKSGVRVLCLASADGIGSLPEDAVFDLVLAREPSTLRLAQQRWPRALRVLRGLPPLSEASEVQRTVPEDGDLQLEALLDLMLRPPLPSPIAVLREELDDWAILFDPDTAAAIGINPTGVAIWRLMDGRRGIFEIADALPERFAETPDEARLHVVGFVEELGRRGFVVHRLEADPSP